MINQIVNVITKLMDAIDRHKKSETDKFQRIHDYLRKIEKSLEESIQELENNKVPTNKWQELQIHAQDLSKNIGDAIGKDAADEISRELNSVLTDTPKPNTDIESLKQLVSKIKAYTDKILLPRNGGSPRPRKSLISRRIFFYSTLAILSAFVAGWFGRQQRSYPPVKWTIVSVFEKDLDIILAKVPQRIKDRVAELTDGQFTIDIDYSQVLNTDQILTEVSEGRKQCGYSGIFYSNNNYKSLFFSCAIPFGLNAEEQTAWLMHKDKDSKSKGLTFMQQVYQDLGLKIIPFPSGGTGGQMGGWFTKEVNSVEDFNKMKIRIPGLGGEVLKRGFGVVTDKDALASGSLSPSKIKEALEKGEIDAAEWIGPYDDRKLGLDTTTKAKYYYYPGWWEPSSTLDMQVNLDAWEKLPKLYQQIFKAVCQETYTQTIAEYDEENSKALREIIDSKTVKVTKFSDEIIQKAQQETDGLLQEYAKDPKFKKVYDEWKTFKERIRQWSDYNKVSINSGSPITETFRDLGQIDREFPLP